MEIGVKKFSCLPCRQRKIRCDKVQPCTHCVKATRQCDYVPPVRGKRRKLKPSKESLHAKLARYESLLKSYGAKIDLQDADNSGESDMDVDEEMTSPSAETPSTLVDSRSDAEPLAMVHSTLKPKFIFKNGSSRYFENEDFEQPEQSDERYNSPPDDQEPMTCSHKRIDDLASYHPPIYLVHKLKEVFLDRIDPVVKFLHMPTFWPSLLHGYQNPRQIERPLEALIFSFYFTTISSLAESECQEMLGEPKSDLVKRYQLPARQAIFNANIFRTTSPITLQAFILYLMGTNRFHHSSSLYVLSGVVVRLAKRMGLQRDGSCLGFSPFEAEIRRRIWWQVVHMDSRISDCAGVRQSLDLYRFTDTREPSNLEDEDLFPEMTTLPPNRQGLTNTVITSLKCDIMAAINQFTPANSIDVRWDLLTGNALSLAEKDKLVQEIKERLETKYLRFCDVSIPLHHFVSVIARSAISKMMLFAHNPRQWADRGAKVPEKERDMIFELGMKLLQLGDIIYSTPSLKKFMWQVSSNHLWDTLLYVLIEIRHRKVGPEVDQAWKLIEKAFNNYPDIIQETTEALDIVLSNWILQVWDECVAARREQGIPEGPVPNYITAARLNKKPGASKTQSNGLLNYPKQNDAVMFEPSVMPLMDPVESYDFSNFLSFDLAPNEWAQLDSLFGGPPQ